MKYLLIIFSITIAAGCRKSDNVPSCINDKIEQLKSQPEGNRAYSVYRFRYNGRMVYYFPPQCCDQFSSLYDENCNLLCNPDGGIAGGGDGRCQDFFNTRTGGVLIWKDPR